MLNAARKNRQQNQDRAGQGSGRRSLDLLKSIRDTKAATALLI